MKKLFALIACLLMVAPLMAQGRIGHMSPEQRAAKHMRFLENKLNLTSDQLEALTPVCETRHQSIRAIRSNDQLTLEQKKEEARAVDQHWLRSAQEVLTDQQLETLRQVRQAKKAQMKKRMHQRKERRDSGSSDTTAPVDDGDEENMSLEEIEELY